MSSKGLATSCRTGDHGTTALTKLLAYQLFNLFSLVLITITTVTISATVLCHLNLWNEIDVYFLI